MTGGRGVGVAKPGWRSVRSLGCGRRPRHGWAGRVGVDGSGAGRAPARKEWSTAGSRAGGLIPGIRCRVVGEEQVRFPPPVGLSRRCNVASLTRPAGPIPMGAGGCGRCRRRDGRRREWAASGSRSSGGTRFGIRARHACRRSCGRRLGCRRCERRRRGGRCLAFRRTGEERGAGASRERWRGRDGLLVRRGGNSGAVVRHDRRVRRPGIGDLRGRRSRHSDPIKKGSRDRRLGCLSLSLALPLRLGGRSRGCGRDCGWCFFRVSFPSFLVSSRTSWLGGGTAAFFVGISALGVGLPGRVSAVAPRIRTENTMTPAHRG